MPSGGEKTKLTKVVLGDRLQDKVNKGIVEAAENVGVELPAGASEFYFLIKEGQYHGSKMIRTRSIETYKNHYKQLWVFLALTGDYESMLLLLSPRLDNVPPMKWYHLSATCVLRSCHLRPFCVIQTQVMRYLMFLVEQSSVQGSG